MLCAREQGGGGGGGIAAQLVTATQFPPFNFFTLSLFESGAIFLNSKYNYLSLASLFRQLHTTVL